jgi:hypothetical protein
MKHHLLNEPCFYRTNAFLDATFTCLRCANARTIFNHIPSYCLFQTPIILLLFFTLTAPALSISVISPPSPWLKAEDDCFSTPSTPCQPQAALNAALVEHANRCSSYNVPITPQLPHLKPHILQLFTGQCPVPTAVRQYFLPTT